MGEVDHVGERVDVEKWCVVKLAVTEQSQEGCSEQVEK